MMKNNSVGIRRAVCYYDELITEELVKKNIAYN